MLEVITRISPQDANLDQETIWIPKQPSPDSVHFISKEIMGEQKTQWREFNIYFYNASDLREFIEACSYAVKLCREAAERNQHLIKFQP